MTTTRRAVLLLGAATALTGCGSSGDQPPTATPDTPGPSPSARAAIDLTALETTYKARLGVSAVDVASGRRVDWRADERIAIASVSKLYAAGALLQRVDAGKAALDTRIRVRPADILEYAPVTGKHAGGTMTNAELCAAALQLSDNTAVNLILAQLGGPPAITAFARTLGDPATRLDRTEPTLNEAARGDERDTTTARGLQAGLQALLTAGPLTAASRGRLLTWMKGTQTSAKRFRAALPSGWTSADKTGTASFGTTNDAGLLIGPGDERVAVAVLSDTTTGDADAAANEALVAAATRQVLKQLGH